LRNSFSSPSSGFGRTRALSIHVEGVEHTLKITINEEAQAATIRLEGRVTGPWVDEFKQAWNSLSASLGTKRLAVDLRGVTHMNSDARRILAEIHKKTGAQFLTGSPMTKYFADEARCELDKNEEGA